MCCVCDYVDVWKIIFCLYLGMVVSGNDLLCLLCEFKVLGEFIVMVELDKLLVFDVLDVF